MIKVKRDLQQCPHKRNPILSENLTGLARLVRSHVAPALENISLWHERDISHSSVERNIGPDSTVTLDFALYRLSNIIENMAVYPKNIEKNLNATHGLIFSQRVMLQLTSSGITRENAYKIVQKNAQDSFKKNVPFIKNLLKDKKVMEIISEKKLKELFDFSYHTKHINKIFNRIFK